MQAVEKKKAQLKETEQLDKRLKKLKGTDIPSTAAAYGFERSERWDDDSGMHGTYVCKLCNPTVNDTLTGAGYITEAQSVYSFRRAVLDHLGTAVHSKKAKEMGDRVHYSKGRRGAALAVGRALYFIIIEGMSYLSFERVLVLMHLCGVDIGTLNHSAWFANKMLEHLYAAVFDKLKALIDAPLPVLNGRKRPVAACADKATQLRRTGNAMGILMFVDGEIKAFMLKGAIVPLTSDSGASNLAKMLIDGITEVVPLAELKQRIAGWSFDGAYIMGNVPQEICGLLGVICAIIFSTFIWDDAHKLELGLGDVRDDKIGKESLFTCDFYSQLAVDVGSIVGVFNYGKGYEYGRSIAAGAGQTLHCTAVCAAPAPILRCRHLMILDVD